jgi:hypothetical protein
MSAKKKKPKTPDPYRIVNAVPSTWTIAQWPADVYPGSPTKGKRLCLAHRDELVKSLALTRIGRELVVMGSAYMRWMTSKGDRVFGYELAPNTEQHAAKRGNGKKYGGWPCAIFVKSPCQK